MNRIRIGRMLLAGLVTLIVFMLIEFLWEGLLGRALFAGVAQRIAESTAYAEWTTRGLVITIVVGLANCIMMMWLYAALRPMFGVGTRNALITGGFVFAFVTAFAINNVNRGLLPALIAAVEQMNLLIELPLALIVGAYVYERG